MALPDETPASPGAGEGAPKAGNGNGHHGNGGNGGNGGGTVRTVVPTRAELLLVAAERQLAKEAAARGGTVRLRSARTEWDDDEVEWVEERRPRRRVVTVVDPEDLPRSERRALGKLRARKVRRIVRHVSPWSVFKVSALFYLCLWLILMVAGVVLWRGAVQAGMIENVGKFWAKATGEKYVDIDGRGVFRAMAAAGGLLVFAATGFTVLMTVLFNLITDLTGGVRLTVVELEHAKRDVKRRAGSLDEVRQKAATGEDVVVEDDVEPGGDGSTAAPAPAPSATDFVAAAGAPPVEPRRRRTAPEPDRSAPVTVEVGSPPAAGTR